MDPALWGHMRWGYFRWGVYDPIFDRVVEQLQTYQPAEAAAAAGYPVGVWDYTDWDSCVWE